MIEAHIVGRRKPDSTALFRGAEQVKWAVVMIRLGIAIAFSGWSGYGLAQPAQVVLLRHAEKPDKEADRHLSSVGRARAHALVSLLLTNSPALSNLPPVALFAPRPGGDGGGVRASETLECLAKELKLPIETPYARKDHGKLIRHVLKNRAYKGKTVVICWVHDNLSEMAAELGVSARPPGWPKSVYDRVWIVRWTGGRATLTNLPQRLLPDDSQR